MQAISPGGGTNLVAGLELGYQKVPANFRSEYSNRVLFLTDGRGESTVILEMAMNYKNMGINVSTIGVGTDFDLNLMVDLSKKGGGSSRFISAREEMEETLGSELDRNEGFADELMILDRYIEILGKELKLEQQRVKEIAKDVEIAPPVPQRSLQDHLKSQFREMTLDLNSEGCRSNCRFGIYHERGKIIGTFEPAQ